MKKSDIEKQLKNELSESAPSDFGSVWSKCVTPEAEAEQLAVQPVTAAAGGGNIRRNTRKTISVIAVSVVAVILCAVILIVALTGKSGAGIVGGGYFTIDVNPSVQVNYDSSGIVASSKALNGDGERLLDGLELDGKTYGDAAEEIFSRCVSYGYFSAERDDNAILMTASKQNGEKDESVTAEISERLAKSFEEKKITGAVISDVDNSKWQKEAEKFGISGQKYELIMRCGTLDESEYGSITISELYSKIYKSDKNDSDKNDKDK